MPAVGRYPPRMGQPPRSPAKPGEPAVEPPAEEPAAPADKKTGKTLQELERIQFDALDRAGLGRR